MFVRLLLILTLMICLVRTEGADKNGPATTPIWPQWRGPQRDASVAGKPWPERLSDGSVSLLWRVPLGPSYSGPVVSASLVYSTETRSKESEVVLAFDRRTGTERWRAEWKGAMTVPFFAAANGSWIRSTPAFDGASLYVAGMRDVLVCLDAATGQERWRVDFVKQFNAPLPDFGCVCSPLVDDEGVYIQAGASVFKLNKQTGTVIWRTLKDGGGMFGSAFSSPTLAVIGQRRQLLVQTREKLAGVDPKTGEVLWSQVIPAYRGMNILTPVPVGDSVFTSSYQNKAWLFKIGVSDGRQSATEAWSNNAQAYMSTPVVVKGHIFMHLQNQRFTCINLKTGVRTWTSQPFGKYVSMVVQGDRILALDQRGILLLIKANPDAFELIDSQKVSDEETWAHLAVCGEELFIRQLNGLMAFRWASRETGR